jgi:hypothetical protein
MELIRFGTDGNEKPDVQLENGLRIDVSKFGEDYNEHFFGTCGIERLSIWLDRNKADRLIISKNIRLGPPLVRPSKIVC